MANYGIPPINIAYICYVGLIDQSNTKLLKANPTIASGDFKISKDGGAFANLTNLPTVTPASGTAVQISLTATEMNADNIVVACIDAAGAEWCDQFINIQTVPDTVPNMVLGAALGTTPWNATLVSDALKAGWTQGVGKWALSGTTLNLYAPDGTTVLKAFTLDSASTPTSRT